MARGNARQPDAGSGADVWHRLSERVGLTALKPRLSDDVRLQRDGEDVQLLDLPTQRALSLSDHELRLVRQFDGKRTIGEMIVAQMEAEQTLAIEPVLRLYDRVLDAGMLADVPTNVFGKLEAHLARLVVSGAGRRLEVGASGSIESEQAVSSYEQMPWRPRTPMLAERARFLRSIGLFRDIDLRTLGALAEAAHEEALPAASKIVSEGQAADRFYIIKSGEANVLKTTAAGASERVAHLGPGDYFGETGLLEHAARTATVRSAPSRPIVVLSFEADTFERIISPQVDAFRGRQQVAARRERLAAVPLFASLPAEDLESVAEVVREQHVPAGATVFEQGDEGDRFYVVAGGRVEVLKNGDPVAELGPGAFFGETALLFTSARTASVAAMVDTVLWSIDKPAFQRIVREQLLGRRDLMPTVLNRLHR